MALYYGLGELETDSQKISRLVDEKKALTKANKELTEQLRLHVVGCSLPSKEEIALEFAEITKQDNKVGCPKNESEAYKRGFIHGTIFKRTKGKSDM